MRTVTPYFKGRLAGDTFSLATAWLCERVDGAIIAFTDHDRDITFDLESVVAAWGYGTIPGVSGTGEQTYLSTAGYAATDVETAAALNVDNMEVHGLLTSPSIVEDDLRAGLWDYANICIFLLDWDPLVTLAVTGIVNGSTIAILTPAAPATVVTGDIIKVQGASDPAYNKITQITKLLGGQLTYPISGAAPGNPTGTITYQNYRGCVIQRIGKIGEVTLDAGIFKAELRGLTQAYSRTIGQLTSPSCRADLGDARCTVDLVGGSPSFTVAGELSGASDDGLVLYDPARTEAGPSGGIAITNITSADPAVVTLASAVPFVAGQPVTMSGIVGPTALNTTVQVRSPVGSTFELSIDTSDTAVYPAYVSGGEVVALGSNSGYFDGGKITILAGANAGLSREVKSYVPGQITLWLPFPYPFDFVSSPTLTGYSMHVGCDKSMVTCRDRFNNIVNFRGEPYLPGIDKLVQVGRHS